MPFLEGELYHLYNRGNNREKIFFSDENYIFFLRKVRKELLPYCDILAYCLMPNHYHFLIRTKEFAKKLNDISKLPRKLGTLQSSYTQAINKQKNRVGSLFQQRVKSKHLEDHGFICFHYIHQNPVKANLCTRLEDWQYSSFRDYYGKRSGTIPNKRLAYDLLEVPTNSYQFYQQSLAVINNDQVEHIL